MGELAGNFYYSLPRADAEALRDILEKQLLNPTQYNRREWRVLNDIYYDVRKYTDYMDSVEADNIKRGAGCE